MMKNVRITDSSFGKAEDWEETNCEKCGEAVYFNENYTGLVLCVSCMDKEFPD